VLPWEEWEYFQNFGDVQRIKNIFFPLLGYHRWYDFVFLLTIHRPPPTAVVVMTIRFSP
jgi:hypothetical protein